jgi:hypothetical protein
MKVCLLRIKEQVGERRSTVYTHSLLKNTSTKHNKYRYVVNQKFEHVDDISFREFFGRIGAVLFFTKYSPDPSPTSVPPSTKSWIRPFKDLLEYIHSRSLSSCNNITTFDFSTIYRTIPHSKLKDKGVGPTVFHKKEWPTYIQIPCARKEQILFCTNPTLILLKSSLKLISKCVYDK